MIRQCLNRRIASLKVLRDEVAAWQVSRDRIQAKVNWQFTTDDARVNLKRLPDYVRSSCSNLRTGPRPDPGGVHGVLQLFRPVLGHRHALPAT